jgi:hypothetical protein
MDVQRSLTTTLVGAAVRGAMRAAPVRIGAPAEPSRSAAERVLSVEVEAAGLAVQVRATRGQGLVTAAAALMVLAAVCQELARPRQFRTWHGKVAGLIPYDFRKPTWRRILRAFWAPDDQRLLTDTAYGVGWGVNLAQLPRLVTGARRLADRSPYDPPRLGSPTSAV